MAKAVAVGRLHVRPRPRGAASEAPLDRILAVDDDPSILLLVSRHLEGADYAVDTAPDGEEALRRLNVYTPDLVITDVTMPRMDGWTFVRRLRTRSKTVLTPVIFLTGESSVESRIRGFQLGADDYLPKPFNGEELTLRVRSVLRRAGRVRAQARQAVAPTAAIRGSLDKISLSTVLTMLEMERVNGTLRLKREGESARLALREGALVGAALDGAAPLQGAECVYHLLTWPDGRFGFDAHAVDMADEIGLPTSHLLLEGARRMDERQQA